MGSYNFKSVGLTNTQKNIEQLSASSLPIGIKTPLELGNVDGILKMHHNISDQVNDNFRNLLLTNFGDRLGLYQFGANLRTLVSEWTTQDDFDAAAIQKIDSAVKQWMSYISLENYSSRIDTNETLGTIVKITITYNIPTLAVFNRSLEVSLRVM